MNTFELHGPLFLVAYVVLFALSIYGAHKTFDHCKKVEHANLVPNLDPYEIAYLSGGSARCFLTAVATLMEKNFVAVDSTKKSITPKLESTAGLHPFEQTLLRICKRDHTTDVAYKEVQAELTGTRQKLVAMKLLASDNDVSNAAGLAFLELVTLPVLTGLVQLFNGIANHRPVGFLIALLVISFAVAVMLPIAFSKNKLTNFGREVLNTLQARHAALQWNCKTNPSFLTGAELAMAFGLFGAGVGIAGSSFMEARKALTPSTAGSGCGGGGCGGGGCNGGGGCGGGGCGGCGGGCGG